MLCLFFQSFIQRLCSVLFFSKIYRQFSNLSRYVIFFNSILMEVVQLSIFSSKVHQHLTILKLITLCDLGLQTHKIQILLPKLRVSPRTLNKKLHIYTPSLNLTTPFFLDLPHPPARPHKHVAQLPSLELCSFVAALEWVRDMVHKCKGVF